MLPGIHELQHAVLPSRDTTAYTWLLGAPSLIQSFPTSKIKHHSGEDNVLRRHPHIEPRYEFFRSRKIILGSEISSSKNGRRS